MSNQQRPAHNQRLNKQYPDLFEALDRLGTAVKNAGPLDRKIAELIQLGAAAAVQSEGSVHSHTRRALEAGATPEEIRHALLLLVSTIGFPRAAAALSWAEDLLE